MTKIAALALLVFAIFGMISQAAARPYEIPIPPGANCNKSCYHKAGLLPTKKLLFKLCGVSGVKILSTKPPPIADMQSFCLTYIYHKFPSPAALVKYQNCEANQALYNKNMFPYKGPAAFWGIDGKPPKFSAC